MKKTNDSAEIILIQNVSEKAAKETVKVLRNNHMIKEKQKTPFQKTEMLLYHYMDFKSVIAEKEKQIEEIEKYGTKQKSKSITTYSSNGGMQSRMESEKAEEQILSISRSIQSTKYYIERIDRAMNRVKQDPYYDIIKMRYFDGMSIEDIAYELEKDASTISRNKSRLISKMQIILFSDEVLDDIFS